MAFYRLCAKYIPHLVFCFIQFLSCLRVFTFRFSFAGRLFTDAHIMKPDVDIGIKSNKMTTWLVHIETRMLNFVETLVSRTAADVSKAFLGLRDLLLSTFLNSSHRVTHTYTHFSTYILLNIELSVRPSISVWETPYQFGIQYGHQLRSHEWHV